ncbi:D-alanyl-D-alanine carboxypeptidase family protein [Actinoplanes sp. NEAU-A12]|uniref:D-alanyl-D-alanine carboxypeptidase family protein n=1 Tax=Actinoplanes sandaracinus TaxID=3045177 RepID=A0ABT6WIM4_9ACTN|nr:D-alanyl-D-alanine carboxypeptidase family protein [Actinoplanes sandaracinus]MDI6099582.1 D-alanyl-D-alanine carboxypeptidase family protein [Actinoplanes sandaracinus]
MNQRHRVTRLAAALAMTLTCAAPIAVVAPSPAQAAVPRVAASYQSLMYRSLTADATMAKYRAALSAELATLKTRTAGVAQATKANDTAQTRLITVTTAHAGVHDRLKSAERALSDAKNALARVSKQRPRSKAAIARAKRAVTAATSTRDARRARLHEAAATLRAAKKDVGTAGAALTLASSARATAASAVERTQRRIAGAGTAAGFAAQATVLSRDVVAEVRPKFTIKDTTTVYGTTVHRSVAYAFKRMVDDARADGIALAGGGFRTKERQIQLRTINGCPDVWTAPASSCRVPTAIPGRSLHEIGLAVDVTSGGRTLTRKSKAFAWMAAHADEYGFVNLPSEAWHWSITGG